MLHEGVALLAQLSMQLLSKLFEMLSLSSLGRVCTLDYAVEFFEIG